MLQAFNSPGGARTRRLSVYFTVLASALLNLLALGAFAQTHVVNPFVGAKVYVNPDYTNEVNAAVATEPAGSTLAGQMSTVATYPTAVWLDRIAAIQGGSVNSGRLSLQGHINAAVTQAGGSPIVIELVIYDLPDRDCAALASNGELSIAGNDTPKGFTTPLTGTGIQEYEHSYIDPIRTILAAAPSNVRFMLVIEDDSLPNMITNTGLSFSLPNCIAANDGQTGSPSLNGVYVQGIQYALNQFHSLPNAYNYLDVGHHGWLGWPANSAIAFPFFANVAKGTTAGFASIDGFITNTANYGPTKEPFLTAFSEPGGGTGSGTLCASPEACSSTFYQFNPNIDEETYAAQFDAGFIAAGFPSTLGFLIDTSRNGWGGPLRPTALSTSTVLDTFVDASKIDERDDMGQWCNQENQGLGVPPTVTPGFFANLQAYVWIKPPGESDGNYPGSIFNGVTSTAGDPNCDPAHDNQLANGMATGAIPNSPPAGTFWVTEFVQDVQNAFPPIQVGSGFAIAASAVSVEQGTTATSSITVSDFGTFSGTVALTISGLPTGVTASFSPTSVAGSAGSTLTFTASATAVAGNYPLTVMGTSGSTIETAPLELTVVPAPNFSITASSPTVNLPIGTNPTDTFTVTFVGGLTGSVSVSATGLPAGLQANFSPSSVNAPGGTIVANFSAQSSTPPGSYPIQIVGTNGTITHSVTITIVIPATGFTLAASPTSLSVTQGASGSDTIRVTDLSGFTGTVSFTVSGLPNGVTASFSPTSSTTSTVLTLAASTTATTGAFTVTVTGTSGSNTATVPITLSVVPGTGTFTLKPSATSLSIAQGGTGTDTITVTDVSPFTGSVTFAASGLPTGVTASFSPASSTTSSVLTLAASSTAAAGTSTVTITGTSGTLAPVTTTVTLTVTSPTGGFTLKPSATALSVVAGSNGTDTITVTDISPFTGSVSFAASGLPTGVTASFSPTSSTTSSILTLAVGSSATVGTSTITITGTSGTLTPVTTTVALTVTSPTGGFTLRPSATALSIASGASGTDTITVTDISPFAGSVSFAASGLPTGVTASFSPTSSTTSSVLTLTAGSTAAAGTSTVTITGTSGTLTATTTIALTVTSSGGGCAVTYTSSPQNTSQFGATIVIKNNGSTALSNWSLTWTFANGQTIANSWNGAVTQNGANVTVSEQAGQTWQNIPAGGSYSGFGFNGTWNGVTNAKPTAFSLNGTACTVN
ncbi:MAG: glycoside hydrolase family 6 protein [Terracidiphilus sp.]